MKRRAFLIDSFKITGYSGLLALTMRFFGATPLKAFSWRNLANAPEYGGQGRVLFLQGRAVSQSGPLEVGQLVSGQVTIKTYNGAVAIMELTDGSLIRIEQQSTVDLLQHKSEGAIINLRRGAILAIVNQSHFDFYPYLIHTPTADYVLKDSVFYCQLLAAGDSLTTLDNSPTSMPPDAGEYACICHGTLDFLTNDLTRVFQVVPGRYHNSFFVTGHGEYHHAATLNHSDQLILETAAFFDRGTHDLSWLRKTTKKTNQKP